MIEDGSKQLEKEGGDEFEEEADDDSPIVEQPPKTQKAGSALVTQATTSAKHLPTRTVH